MNDFPDDDFGPHESYAADIQPITRTVDARGVQVFDCLQYSPEWWLIRRGIPTASNFGKILTPAKGDLSKSADDYIAELIADRAQLHAPITTDHPLSRDMANGLNMEPEARNWFALEADVEVKQVGFCLTADGRFGCSPDGLIGEDGGLELKCPSLKTQVKYLLDGELPNEYRAQVHGSLIVTGRAWWEFVSYAPGLPPFRVRVFPDAYTAKLRDGLEAFHGRYMDLLAKFDLPPLPTVAELVDGPLAAQGGAA